MGFRGSHGGLDEGGHHKDGGDSRASDSAKGEKAASDLSEKRTISNHTRESDEVKTTGEAKGKKELGEKVSSSRVGNGELPEIGETCEEMKRESLERENEKIEAHFSDFQRERWGESKEVLEQKQALIHETHVLSHRAYEDAGQIAKQDEHLRTFSDHRDERHTKQVVEKTLLQLDQYKEMAEKNPEKWGDVIETKASENTVIFAAMLHDTGMAGNLTEGIDPKESYEQRRAEHPDPESGAVGEAIRKVHSCESAMFILSQRDRAEALNRKLEEGMPEGQTGDRINVDEAAMITALHSKSASLGESKARAMDLSDREKLLAYAGELKQVATQHGLEFDDGFLYKEGENGQRVPDEEALKRVATEAAALRMGDSFRPSSDVQVAQSGRAVFIDCSEIKPIANDRAEEMAEVRLGYFDENGKEIPELRVERGEGNVDVMSYAVGEHNIRDISPGEVDESGDMRTDICLRDGNCCPCATAFVINERIKEAASLSGERKGDMVFHIHSEVPMDDEVREKLQSQLERYQGIPESREKKDHAGDKAGDEKKSLIVDHSDEHDGNDENNGIKIIFD